MEGNSSTDSSILEGSSSRIPHQHGDYGGDGTAGVGQGSRRGSGGGDSCYCGKTGYMDGRCANYNRLVALNQWGRWSLRKLEKAKTKSLEIGKRILQKVNMTTDRHDEETTRNQMIHQLKASWKEVAERDPIPSLSDLQLQGEAKVVTSPKGSRVVSAEMNSRVWSRRSLERAFSADDAVKLIEFARIQLRRELEQGTGSANGWRMVTPTDRKKRERVYARSLVEGFRSSIETEKSCWKCNKRGHESSRCPWGVICFNCKKSGHKKVACPKREADATECKRNTRNTKARVVKNISYLGDNTKAPYKSVYKASERIVLSEQRAAEQSDDTVDVTNVLTRGSLYTTKKSGRDSVEAMKQPVEPSSRKGKIKGDYPRSEKHQANLGSSEGVASQSTLLSELNVEGSREDEGASYKMGVEKEAPLREQLERGEMEDKATEGREGLAARDSIYEKIGGNLAHDFRYFSYKISITSRNKMKQALLFGKSVLKKATGGWKVGDDSSDQDQDRSSLSFNSKDRAWINASESVDSRVFQETQTVVKAMSHVQSESTKGGATDSYPSLPIPMGEIKRGIQIDRKQQRTLANDVWIGEKIALEEGMKKITSGNTRTRVSGECIKSTREKDVQCWQCWDWGHDSNGCHLGKVCFLCRRPGHKKAGCHLRKKSLTSIGREIAGGMRGAQWSGETNELVERIKTCGVGGGGSDLEMKSNIVGNTVDIIENESSREKETSLEVGTTSSSSSDLVGESADLHVASLWNVQGVCHGVGIEMLTGELVDSKTQHVEATNMAEGGNEENQANVSGLGTDNVVRTSLFEVLDEEFMTNLNKVLGISLPPGATCQIYHDLERERCAG